MNRVKLIATILIIILSCFGINLFAASPKSKTIITDNNTYYIPESGIADHSNPSIQNSIAWYFKTYGVGKTYLLNSSGVNYNINSTITVPTNSVFKGKDALGSYSIKASTGLDKKGMIVLGSGCTLQYLNMDGNREAGTVVSAANSTGATILNCTIKNSKNDYVATDGNAYTLLINANSNTNFSIDGCVLENAGTNPKLNSATNQSNGYAILMWSAINSRVTNCDISYTSTCGIGFTGSSIVSIIGNNITKTGLNRESGGPLADALTAYHNWNNNTDENFTIKDNTISFAGNHGIHVSGKGIDIQNNTISNQQLSAIMVDDWRSKINGGGENDNEFSENVTIKDNKCDDPLSWVWQPGNSNRKIYVDRVNNETGMTLDYRNNKDISEIILGVNSTNYHFPIIFGIHPTNTTSITPVSTHTFFVRIESNNLVISDMSDKSSLRVIGISGKVFYNGVNRQNIVSIPLNQHGVYIVEVKSGSNIEKIKVIY